MSIDLRETPTLQAVATADEHILVADLEKRVEAAAKQAASLPEVLAAEENQRVAGERLTRLTRAERSLNAIAKEIAERTNQVRDSVLDGVIESAADGAKLDFKPLTELIALEHRARYLTRAIERLVETLLL